METKCWNVDNSVNKDKVYPQIVDAAKILQLGQVVAFPTETVYGLGANAFSDEAVQLIFQAKGRPSDNPLIVHIANNNQLAELVEEIPEGAKKLMEAFWPGPLTIILKSKKQVSKFVTAGLSTVGVRMPDHPVALALIEASGLPIAAPSANTSGKPSPTSAKHVFEDLNGRIAGIVDGGSTGVGLESTVIDCSQEVFTILRPGSITPEMIKKVVSNIEVDPATVKETEAPKSPGMKYKHYAPDAQMHLVNGSMEFIHKLIHNAKSEGKKVGILTTEENINQYKADVVLACGKREDLTTVAASLYDCIRQFNEENVDIIFCESFPYEGIGIAIMNRLWKACGHSIITE
ncbi:L-threonylcarbamoyladenylate synthase [Gottfriedia solisilvae]|uniref:Threonylcarbamoyl-AMP synthase n=1 Tax=Gottfriedia solisilvae TaxID=1516104 RepID=A0A8J3AU06_9BACI|nr:L-threonylcarbamoyladenylate synthase [Gottfriedia solisilvae]GGI16832.1 threonylcarbamoyl-AMP synthase [Gottfriedia solisilvae]